MSRNYWGVDVECANCAFKAKVEGLGVDNLPEKWRVVVVVEQRMAPVRGPGGTTQAQLQAMRVAFPLCGDECQAIWSVKRALELAHTPAMVATLKDKLKQVLGDDPKDRPV